MISVDAKEGTIGFVNERHALIDIMGRISSLSQQMKSNLETIKSALVVVATSETTRHNILRIAHTSAAATAIAAGDPVTAQDETESAMDEAQLAADATEAGNAAGSIMIDEGGLTDNLNGWVS